ESVLNPYNEAQRFLSNQSSASSLYANVHPDATIVAAAEDCEKRLSKFRTELALNRDLYEQIGRLVKIKGLDADAARLVDHELRSFRRAGVEKDDSARTRIKKLDEELVAEGQAFDRIVRDDVR